MRALDRKLLRDLSGCCADVAAALGFAGVLGVA
jgi:hypothetical protein